MAKLKSGTRIYGNATVDSTLTSSSGPILVGTATSTGTTSQTIQVTGGGYVSGNLGVGITNPQYKLDVVGDINSSTAIRVGGKNIVDESLRLSVAFS